MDVCLEGPALQEGPTRILLELKAVRDSFHRAIAAPDEAAGRPWLEEACQIFDKEWHTGLWDFYVRPFETLEEVIREVCNISADEALAYDPDDPHNLGMLYQRCFQDPEANQKLRDYFREFVRM